MNYCYVWDTPYLLEFEQINNLPKKNLGKGHKRGQLIACVCVFSLLLSHNSEIFVLEINPVIRQLQGLKSLQDQRTP